jgi:CheY-like chemotaxis protein
MMDFLLQSVGPNISIELDIANDLPSVRMDANQLELALMNLAVNARDAMPSGGRLTISTRLAEAVPARCARHGVPQPREGFVVLSVADSGTGMDAAVLGRIFEPFFTTKAVGKGTGIGLATVQSVVKQAAGFIEVHSTPGEGSCFEVYLPVSEQVAPPAAQGSDEVLPSGRGERVLLVEDQPAVRALACGQLALLGYSVQAFASAEECLELLADPGAYADLIVTDVVLRGMDGPALIERVQRARPGIGVLYMSGYTDDRALRSGLDTTRVPLLYKPFSLRELARAARSALDAARKKRSV